MDPRNETEDLEMTEIDDDLDLEDEDNDELVDADDDLDDDDEDFEDESDEAELSQAELDKSEGRDTERELDHGLKETFPASDPVSINPGAD